MAKLRIRQNFLPRIVLDWLCFGMINFFVPMVFVFDVGIVLPEFHEPFSLDYNISFFFALFLLLQLKANYVAVLVIDTSVDYENLVVPDESPEKLKELGWHHCEKCKKLAPPRSWHCVACDVCILKRDHHCLFTGCCIGHENHRHFIAFIVYLFFGSLYAFLYNSMYLFDLKAHIFLDSNVAFKVICPILMLLTDDMFNSLALMFYNLNILAGSYAFVMLYYHIPTLIFGGVTYEKDFGYPYSKGSWWKDVETVLGEKMFWVFLSPFMKSKLPDDGINWVKTANKIADKTAVKTADQKAVKVADKKTK